MLYETQTVMTIFPYMYAQTRNGKISKLTGLSSFHNTKFYALFGTEKTVWGASQQNHLQNIQAHHMMNANLIQDWQLRHQEEED